MSHVRWFAALLAASSFAAAQTPSISLQEDFSADPAGRGWHAFGDAALFSWDSTHQNLHVTWDSSQTNSYYYHALGTVLRSDSDFNLSFDLDLTDAAIGGYGAELAVGLLNLTNATSPAFFRGSGADSPNLVEFDYFPDPAGVLWFGPSITAVLVDRVGVGTNNWSTNGYLGLELPMSTVLRVELAYTGVDQTLRTTIWQNGTLLTTVPDAGVWPAFLGFEVDTLAVESYSDDNGWGSLFAHGTVGHIVFTATRSPLGTLTGQFDAAGHWLVQFTSSTNWLYTLERTTDFVHWSPTAAATTGTGDRLVLRDPSSPPVGAFYRVSATRP